MTPTHPRSPQAARDAMSRVAELYSLLDEVETLCEDNGQNAIRTDDLAALIRDRAALAAATPEPPREGLDEIGAAHALTIGGYGVHCACGYYFAGFGPNPRTQASSVERYGFVDETLFQHIARALRATPEPPDRTPYGVVPANCRLILASENLLDIWGTRTERGERITVEWGEPSPEGWYEPTFTVHGDDVLTPELPDLSARETWFALLRQTRRAKSMTLRDVAERVGIHFTYLSKLETGKDRPSADLVSRLDATLDASGDLVERFSSEPCSRCGQAATPEPPDLSELRRFLELRPAGTVGPDKVPWFIHCGISHAEGAECVVCVALEQQPETGRDDDEDSNPDPNGSWGEPTAGDDRNG